MPKKALETFTESMFYVLMAFMSGAMCGIEVAEFVERRSNGRVKPGPATLYTILAKFEKEKYIKGIEVSGRKRTYEITEKGRVAYIKEFERLKSCVLDGEREADL